MSTLYLDPKLVPSGTSLPNSAQEIVNLVAQYTGIAGLGTVSFINIGNSTPASEDRDKPWNKLDLDGFSLGWWNYADGSWRPERPIGQITWFGHLLTTAPPGYALLNGTGNYTDEDGTVHPIPDWKDRVAIGSGGSYAPLDTGGVDTLSVSLDLPDTDDHALTAAEIPPHPHPLPINWNLRSYGDGGGGAPTVGDVGPTAETQNNVGGGSGHNHTNSGKATGNIDIRQKYIAAPALIWIAS